MKGQAGKLITHSIQIPLIGEEEEFSGSDYQVSIDYPEGYEWLHSVISYEPFEIVQQLATRILKVTLNFQPRRPIRENLQLVAENPLGQKWSFILKTIISQPPIMKIITLESYLNIETSTRIQLDEPIRQKTYFTARLTPGSTVEFRVLPSHGVVETSLSHQDEFLVEVFFKPTSYGKIMRAVLVLDTNDVEYVIEVLGKLPEYVPPFFEHSRRIIT